MTFANDVNRANRLRSVAHTLLLASISLSTSAAAWAQPTLEGSTFCPMITGQGTIGYWTQWNGNALVNHREYGNSVADVTFFGSIFDYAGIGSNPWPGAYDLYTGFYLPPSKYLSAQFTVPQNFDLASLQGQYSVDATHFSAPVSMSISTTCGDFGQQNPSTVIPNCSVNAANAGQSLAWQGASDAQACVLTPGTTYYLNVINADISQLPSTGTAVTTANSACVAAGCLDPIVNGPGNWGVADDIFYSPFE